MATILHLEGSRTDAERIGLALRRFDPGLDHLVVVDRAGFLAALGGSFDLILSDSRIPGFSGLEALQAARAAGREEPFILVPGTTDAEDVASAFQAGITDFVLKDRLDHLGFALRRALNEAAEHRARTAAEAGLRQSEEHFRLLFQANLAGSAIHEMLYDAAGKACDYRFLAVNAAFEEQTGLRRSDLLGRTVREVIPQVEPCWIERYAAVVETGQAMNFEDHSLSLGRWFEVTAFKLAQRQFAVSVTDITARKQADRERHQHLAFLQRLLDTVPSPIYHKDGSGVLRGCNQAFLDFTGETRERLLGLHAHAAIPAVLAAEINRLDTDLLARGGRREDLFTVPAADGSHREIQVIKATFAHADGTVAGLVGVIIDLTDRIRQEKALRQALEQANAASRAKSQFLSTMSHEIRTPLHGIIGMTGVLMESGLTAEQASMAEVIQNCGHGLQAVIGDVLDLAKIESGNLELDLKDIDIRDLVEAVRRMFAPSALTRNLCLSVRVKEGVPARMRSDPVRLRQILINLVGNAVKFTHQGEIALVVGTSTPASGPTTVVWEVSDTGPGIPDSFLPRLFEPFSQADSSPARRHGGTGLGLAIAKRLADRLGGMLSVDTEPGRGTRFRFEQPLAPGVAFDAAAAPGPERRIPPAWTRPPLVLLVEDDPDCQTTIDLMLTTLGCRVRRVGDGNQALAAFAESSAQVRDGVQAGIGFDLVLMDCQMPECDGITATSRLRQLIPQAGQASASTTRRLPIVAITGNVFTEDRDRCLAVGMDDFLAKPCTLETLADCLRRWLPEHLAPAGRA